MFKSIKFIVIFTLIISFLSCEKENEFVTVIKTVTPLNYFPAFPGSYWRYTNGAEMHVTTYKEFIYNSSTYGEDDYDTLILPEIVMHGFNWNADDTIRYVNEYSISRSISNIKTKWSHGAFMKFLIEIEGSEFSRSEYFSGHQAMGYNLNSDTTIVVNGVEYSQVIVIGLYELACPGGKEWCSDVRYYYAKDIGLILEQSKVEEKWVNTLELKEYKIIK